MTEQSQESPEVEVEDDAPPSDEQLESVRRLVERQQTLSKTVADLEADLTIAKTGLRRVEEVDLPAAMTALKLESFALRDGTRVAIATAITASIPKDAIEAGHRWLEEHGHGDLIKRRFTINFGRDDLAWAKKFRRDCANRKRPLNLEEKEWVEPQTLSAFAREQIKVAASEGSDPEVLAPSDVLGIFRRTYAKITPPKKEKPQ